MNFATIQGCPPPKQVAKEMELFGLPQTEEFGVLNQQATDTAIFAAIIEKKQQAVQKLDPESKELVSEAIEKVTVHNFAIKPAAGIMEVYTGSAATIEHIAAFLSGAIGLPTLVGKCERDILPLIDKLKEQVKNFKIKSVKVSDYAANSYMCDTYGPKFMDSQHGDEFMQEHADFLESATVKFSGSKGQVTLTIRKDGCFNYSCNEDDNAGIQALLRKLMCSDAGENSAKARKTFIENPPKKLRIQDRINKT